MFWYTCFPFAVRQSESFHIYFGKKIKKLDSFARTWNGFWSSKWKFVLNKNWKEIACSPSRADHAQKHTELYCYVCIVNELHQVKIIQPIRSLALAPSFVHCFQVSISCSFSRLSQHALRPSQNTRNNIKRGIFSTHQKLNETLFIHCALTCEWHTKSNVGLYRVNIQLFSWWCNSDAATYVCVCAYWVFGFVCFRIHCSIPNWNKEQKTDAIWNRWNEMNRVLYFWKRLLFFLA